MKRITVSLIMLTLAALYGNYNTRYDEDRDYYDFSN